MKSNTSPEIDNINDNKLNESIASFRILTFVLGGWSCILLIILPLMSWISGNLPFPDKLLLVLVVDLTLWLMVFAISFTKRSFIFRIGMILAAIEFVLSLCGIVVFIFNVGFFEFVIGIASMIFFMITSNSIMILISIVRILILGRLLLDAHRISSLR